MPVCTGLIQTTIVCMNLFQTRMMTHNEHFKLAKLVHNKRAEPDMQHAQCVGPHMRPQMPCECQRKMPTLIGRHILLPSVPTLTSVTAFTGNACHASDAPYKVENFIFTTVKAKYWM